MIWLSYVVLNLVISVFASWAAPTNASAMAVLSTSAIVIVTLRRMPAATPDTTKLARMEKKLLRGGGQRPTP